MSAPYWSTLLRLGSELEERADSIKVHAVQLRCGAEESGGVRCTADAYPKHEHRYRREDLPTWGDE